MQTTSRFQLSALHEQSCWSLFKHFAFGNWETSENANLHEIGRGIVKKCNGSPLAIKAFGGILRYEMHEEKWREILEIDISEIDEMGEVMPALRLSYLKLPQYLKPCFLYLSMFPKDYYYEKDMVIRLWMAQGYIKGNTRNLKTLEEIGSEYFDELQGRSLIVCGASKGYLLHDLIHDLARSISHEAYKPGFENDQQCIGICKVYHLYLTREDKLLGSFFSPSDNCPIRTFVGRCPQQNFDTPFSYEFACARVLDFRFAFFANTLNSLKHLRYLCIRNSHMETLPENLCLLYNLQTLDLDCINLRELPKNIKNLINLRYFHLSSDKIQQLPESIFLLRNLHTLLLTCCKKLKKLPRGIEQLTRLHILHLPASLINLPSGIGKLTTLTLLIGYFRVMDHDLNEGLGELKDMDKLGGWLCISGLSYVSDVEYFRNANLASKPNLRKLNLNFQEEDSIRSCQYKNHFPLARNEKAKRIPGLGHTSKVDFLFECPGYMRRADFFFESYLHLTVISSKNANNENDEKIQDVVLQSLQRHGNLTELAIKNYGGRIFPSWLLNPLLPKLTTLTLNFWTEPNFLPPFGQLPHLRILDISGNAGVRNVGDELSTYSLLAEYGYSKQPREPSYPSLEVLSLTNMLNLVEWHRYDSDFPCLDVLTIDNCPKLWKIATIPHKVRYITFEYCPKLELLTCPSVIRDLKVHKCGFHEIMFGSISENLTISNCVELTSINWSDGGLNSVKEVTFECCPKLGLVTIPVGTLKLKIHDCGFRKLIFQSVSENLTISNCVELTSIKWIDEGLNYVREISFKYCPKLKLITIPVKISKVSIHECGVQEIVFLSVSENLIISNCVELISLNLMDGGLDSIRNVGFKYCPKLVLQFAVIDVLHSMIQRAEIYHCPRVNWDDYVYERDTSLKELILYGNNEICLSLVNSTIPFPENSFKLFLTTEEFQEAESITCAASVELSCGHITLNLVSLVRLDILGCTKIMSVIGLDNLSNLKHLTISCCLQLCNWNDKTLPLSLESLELSYCGQLSSLPLLSVQNHSSTLKALVITNCSRLAVLEGFDGLMKLNIVTLVHCRNISISPATKTLQFRPRITNVGDCPLMRDWCQRNRITYNEAL